MHVQVLRRILLQGRVHMDAETNVATKGLEQAAFQRNG